MQTRALVTGDYKLVVQALKLDARIERNRLAQRRIDLQERRARALEREDDMPLVPKTEEELEAFFAKARQELEKPGGW